LEFAAYCINSRGDHFATTAEQSQHIDQFLIVSAQAGPDNLGILAMLPKHLDGLGK